MTGMGHQRTMLVWNKGSKAGKGLRMRKAELGKTMEGFWRVSMRSSMLWLRAEIQERTALTFHLHLTGLCDLGKKPSSCVSSSIQGDSPVSPQCGWQLKTIHKGSTWAGIKCSVMTMFYSELRLPPIVTVMQNTFCLEPNRLSCQKIPPKV